MPKLLTLLILIVFALISLTGYLFLTEKIAAGEQQVAAGEKRLTEGEEKLERGKSKLAHGKRTLSGVKVIYNGVNNIPLMGVVDSLPVTGTVMKKASKEIAKGDMEVAQGSIKVKAGEGELAAGQLALSRGKKLLSLANLLRSGCMVGVVFFTAVALTLGFYWRRSLLKGLSFRRTKV